MRGFVQGVGFRYATRTRAAALGLGGWVSNRPDGSVEAVFEGEEEAVESMVAWCREGPRGARVEAVDVERESPRGDRAFAVR